MKTWRMRPFFYSQLAAALGWRVRWYRGVKCPCFEVESGGPARTCAVCSGFGYAYDGAQDGRLNMRMTEAQKYADQGEFTAGTLTVSVPAKLLDKSVRPFVLETNPIYGIGENDLVVLLDAETRQHDLLVRGERDKLRYLLASSVEEVIAIVGGQKVVYDSVDYSLSGDSEIIWEIAKGPADGTQYTVLYWARPEFVVRQELGAERIHGGDDLPKRLVLELRDKGVVRV